MDDRWHLERIYALLKTYGFPLEFGAKRAWADVPGDVLDHVLSYQRDDHTVSWSWIVELELDAGAECDTALVLWIVALLELTCPGDHAQMYANARADDRHVFDLPDDAPDAPRPLTPCSLCELDRPAFWGAPSPPKAIL